MGNEGEIQTCTREKWSHCHWL